MSVKGSDCQVSKLVNSGTCPRPTTGPAPLAQAQRPQPAEVLFQERPADLAAPSPALDVLHSLPRAVCDARLLRGLSLYIFEHLVGENIHRYRMSLTSLEC